MIEGKAVLVDLRTDSYFTLDESDQMRLRACVDTGAPANSDTRLSEALGTSGTTVEIIRAQTVVPARTLIDERSSASFRVSDVLRISQCVWTLRLRLRRDPIAKLLEGVLISAAGTGKRVSETDLDAKVRRFNAARRWVPVKGNCLLDSLALITWLGDAGRKMELVFGAKLNPFGAHCWLQLDDLVLNDRLESVAAFTPVRVEKCSGATL